MSTSDKGAEKSIEQGEDIFKRLFNYTADALFLHDLEGRFVEVNQAACDSLGYTREELLQYPFSTIVKDGDPEALGDLWARVLQGKKITVPGFHQRRDGATFPVEVHLSPFEYEGRPHILASARDITERRTAEKAIQDNAEKYRRLQANIPGMVYQYALHPDGSFSFPYANSFSRELFGVAPEDLMRDATLLVGLIHPDDRERRDQAIKHSADTLQPFREELRHIVKGEVRWYDCISRPEPQPNGDILWDGIMLEITERKRAEMALAESEQRFKTFMDHLPAVVFIKDQAGRLLFANRYLQETFGWEDCQGKTTEELLPPEFAARMMADDKRALAEGPLVIQERIIDSHGAERFFDTYKFPVKAEGPSLLVGGIAVDVTARQQAEEALNHEKLLTEAILDSLPGTFFLLDSQGRQLRTNRSEIELTDYSLEELTSMDALESIAEEDRPAAQRAMEEVLEKGEASLEASMLTKDGRKIPFLFNAKKFIIDDIPHILGTGLDITARKQAEGALRESEKKYHSLYQEFQGILNAIPDILCLLSPDLRIVWGNEATVLEIPGKQQLEIVGKHCYPLRHERSEPCENCPVVRCFSSGKIETEEVVSFGNIYELRAVPLYDDQGELRGAIEVARNITARKLMEAALRKSEEQLRLALQAAKQGLYDLNIQTGEANVSPEYATMLGFDPGEFQETNASWIERLHPDDREQVTATYQAYVQGKIPDYSVEFRQRTQSGDWKWILSLGKIVAWDEDGKPLRMLGTHTDITERKRAEAERAKLEAQMQEVQKLESLGVLAGGIAHDFNNLLMAILGNADLAMLSLSPASPAYPNVEEISRASLQAADLCRQMLAYSGKGRFVVGRYDLSEIVREMAQILKVSISKKITLHYYFAADLPAVEVDATQMRQVIMNLITNASEALGNQSGVISVSTGVMDCDRAYLAESYLDDKLPAGKYVYLEVGDTGAGMDEQTRRRIFDPFFTTKFTGRGLGLAAVLGIVRGHQGAIKVYSEVGQGTTFKVLLPAQEWGRGDRRPSAAAAPIVQPTPGGGTILLVDDDPDVRKVGTQMLQRLGFKVLTAAHGPEGLKIFQECGGEIDGVILDLTMPEMGGEEVFRELRRLRHDVRVILSSGYNEQEVTQRFVGQGLAGFIQKPYRVANLREILNRVFG